MEQLPQLLFAGGVAAALLYATQVRRDQSPPPPPSTARDDVSVYQRHKRTTGVLTWDETFMSLALLIAQRSKDPRTQVGCVIVDDNNRVVALGYNGLPKGVDDDSVSWAREPPPGLPPTESWLETKAPWVVHAELNAVLNRGVVSLAGCRAYTGLAPCNECAKVLIQAGISEVIFAQDTHSKKKEFIAARKLFDLAGVPVRHYTGSANLVNVRR